MIRKMALLLALVMLIGGSALAELMIGDRLMVDYCKEYITLREYESTDAPALDRVPKGEWVVYNGPADDGFTKVSYNCRTGYVLAKYLNIDRVNEDYYPRNYGPEVSLTEEEYYNVNLFLSNFSEVGWNWTWGYVDEQATDEALNDFAIEHIWFNQQDKIEDGQWGEFNVRLSDQYIPDVCRKYLGKTPGDLSRTRLDYKNGYYYWEETGGHTPGGYVILKAVEQLENGRYRVTFNVVDPGIEWNNDMCRLTLDEALASSEYAQVYFEGTAVIDTGSSGLGDRSQWRLERWALGQTEY